MTASSRRLALLVALLAFGLPTAALHGQETPGTAPPPDAAAEKTAPLEVDPNIAGDGNETPPPTNESTAPPELSAKDAAPAKSGNAAPVQMEGSIMGFSALPALQIQALSATRERPLFRADRRPPPPPPPPDQVAPPPDDKVAAPAPFDYELKGIVSMKSGSIAIIGQPALTVPLRSKVGDILNGWTLTAIEPRAAVFENNGEERRLTMFGSSAEWSNDENGLRKVTIGAGAGVAPQPLEDPSQGVVKADDAGATAAPPVDQPPPIPEETPKEVRKVY